MEGDDASGAKRPKLRAESFRELTALFVYLRPYKGRFYLAVTALIVSMAFGLMFPFLVGRMLDAASATSRGVAGGTWHSSVNLIALFLVGTLAVQAVLQFVASYWFNVIGERSVVQLRRDLYERLILMPMDFFGARRVGELASRLSSDMTQIQETFTGVVPQFLRQIMLLFGGFAFIMATSAKLALVMVSSFPVLILLAVMFGRRIRRVSSSAQDRLADSATIIEETLTGIQNVKAFGNESYEARRYSANLHEYLAVILRTAKYRAALISFIIFGIFGSIILVLWYGATLMSRGEFTHGQLTQFILYTTFVGGAVASFADVFSQVQKTLGATERVRQMLRETPELPLGDGAPIAERLGGAVEFRDVCFRYESRPDVPVLQGLSLRAAAGEKIALVGPSGAGKSTIVSLLLQFYKPESGLISFDGKEAETFDVRLLRANMALVPQEVILFGGTIRENIAYGRPGASEEDIVQASRRANCHEFISGFPEGYSTLVGERGIKLSGGQRQRIAIARALLKDPAILILDEATSSLDSESEQLIQEAMHTLLEGRTAFIIAHRLSTVRQVDRIYVIDGGTAVEAGTHAELMEREGGIYRRLAEIQLS